MKKQQAQEQFDKLMIEAEKLRSIIKDSDKAKEEKFFELIQNLTLKWDKANSPNSIFYFKEGKFWLEYDEKKCCVWIRYNGFWEVFEKVYKLNYYEIVDFMGVMLEEHFKWEGVTPEESPEQSAIMLEERWK